MTIDLPTVSEAALQLPVGDRLELAQTLWDSVPAPPDRDADENSLTVARRRARELDENPELAIPHDDVMQSIRQAYP